LNIDLGPTGKQGIEATVRKGVCFINGTDHRWDWVHHFTPGARRRELRAAREIIALLPDDVHTVAGYSMGGAIAQIVATLKPLHCRVYASKRPPLGYIAGVSYRQRGDWVPALPPWRPSNKSVMIGRWQPPWTAHNWANYRQQMQEDGSI